MLKQLLQHAAGIEPPKKWPTYDGKQLDRNDFLTSSEVAYCLRKSWFGKQPGKQSFVSNGYAERGHAVETWFVDKIKNLESLGYKFEYVGEKQRSFYDADIGVAGTPDGLMTTPQGRKYLLEIKSIDPRFNKRNLPKKQHVYQVQLNMHLIQKCLNIKLDGGILFYIDASDVYNNNEFNYEFDPKLVKECVDRAKRLFLASDADALEPEGLYNGDCERCPHTADCSATIDVHKALQKAGSAGSPFSEGSVSRLAEERPEDMETLSLTEEDKVVLERYHHNHSQAKVYSKLADEIKDQVDQLVMKYNGMVVHDGTLFYATTQGGRETVDKEELEKRGIQIPMKVGKPFILLRMKDAE